MDELEDFSTLLAALPRSGADAWRRAAERELRGAALDTISFDLADGATETPYRSPGRGGDTNRFVAPPTSSISDLRSPSAALGSDVLQELEGGVQGIWLSDLRSAVEDFSLVRFDIITTALDSPVAASLSPLCALIPPEQRSSAAVWTTEAPAEAGAAYVQLRDSFPRGAVVLEAGARPENVDLAKHLSQAVADLHASLAGASDAAALATALVLAVNVGPSSPRTLVELRALKLLFANLCMGFGLAHEPPPLRIWARVEPSSGDSSPEAYLIDAGVRAVAAMTSGVVAITVGVHGGIEPRNQAAERRRARNVANVLQIEAGLHLPQDPLAGAAWVEHAAIRLANRVWSEF